MRTFHYMIDLDERGEFRAHVKNAKDKVIFEIEGLELVEDGWMRHKEDLSGLTEFLVSARMLNPTDTLVLGD